MALEEEDAIFIGLFMSFYSYGTPVPLLKRDPLNRIPTCRSIYRYLRPIREAREESKVERAYGPRLGYWVVVSGNGGNGHP
jgi:hypothetical protein